MSSLRTYWGISDYEAEMLADKARRQLRCSRCGAFLSTLGQAHKCRTGLPKPNNPSCPRCDGKHLWKSGTNVFGVQVWRCRDCKRCFREVLLPRTDYGGRIGNPHLVYESYGKCLRCGMDKQHLGNGLCLTCTDRASKAVEFYYRRAIRKVCIRCGNAQLETTRLCHSCNEKSKKWRREKHRGKRG